MHLSIIYNDTSWNIHALQTALKHFCFRFTEGSDYILKHYHHLHNICHEGSSEIPFCLKSDKYTKVNNETIKWYEVVVVVVICPCSASLH